MNTKLVSSIKFTSGLLLSAVISTAVMAQSGSLRSEYPELADLYNAFDVTQAGLFDAIGEINADPQTQQARNDLRTHLAEMARMDMHDMDHSGGEMGMDMTGPSKVLMP